MYSSFGFKNEKSKMFAKKAETSRASHSGPIKLKKLESSSIPHTRNSESLEGPTKDIEAIQKRFRFVEAPAKIEYCTSEDKRLENSLKKKE
jgi:hypothetical protein